MPPPPTTAQSPYGAPPTPGYGATTPSTQYGAPPAAGG